MSRLVKMTGESAFLLLVSGDQSMCVLKVASRQIKEIAGTGWTGGGHSDRIVLTPSITLDGVPLDVEGRNVHPDVVAVCQELGGPGY